MNNDNKIFRRVFFRHLQGFLKGNMVNRYKIITDSVLYIFLFPIFFFFSHLIEEVNCSLFRLHSNWVACGVRGESIYDCPSVWGQRSLEVKQVLWTIFLLECNSIRTWQFCHLRSEMLPNSLWYPEMKQQSFLAVIKFCFGSKRKFRCLLVSDLWSW